jgi:hypothetical protein
MDKFLLEHQECFKEVLQKLENYRHVLQAVVVDGCESCLVEAGFENSPNALGDASKNRASARQGTANTGKSDKKMTYTEMAAKRKECLRLQRFVKLVDYLITNTLHSLAITSLTDLLKAVFNYCEDGDVDMDASESAHLPFSDVATSILVQKLDKESFTKPKRAVKATDGKNIFKMLRRKRKRGGID